MPKPTRSGWTQAIPFLIILAAAGFVLIYIAVVALSLPGASICTSTGGFLFGVFPGAIFNVSAATAGAVIVFLAARRGFGARVATPLDDSAGAVRRPRDELRRNAWSFLLAVRLVSAMLRIPVGRFALTAFLGIIPVAIIFTWLGSGLGALIAMGKMPDMGILFPPQFPGPLLGLAALALLPVLARVLRR